MSGRSERGYRVSTVPELAADVLRRTIDPLTLDVGGQPAAPVGIVGQQRAMAALRFGLGIHNSGFHIFVAGPPGIGKMTAVRTFLAELARAKPIPPDWCYLNNFDDPYQPRAYRLPPGRGRALQEDLRRAIAHVRQELPKALSGEAYIERREEIGRALSQQRETLLAQLNERALREGFVIKVTPMGIGIIPAADGRPLKDSEFEALPEAARADLLRHHDVLQEELERVMKQGRALELAAQEQFDSLDTQVVMSVVGGLFDDLDAQYRDLPEIAAYLRAVQSDILAHSAIFRGDAAGAETRPEGLAAATPWLADLPFRKYQVNVLVDHSRQSGAPVIVEMNPTHPNLLGRIEREALFGALSTDFTLIRAGALHRANGGYLVMRIEDLLRNPLSWDALKRALRGQEIVIEDVGEQLGLINTKSLRPQSVGLDVKLVLVGSPLIYALLHSYDEAFPELFKVKADFDTIMPYDDQNVRDSVAFAVAFCAREQLKPLDAAAVARLLEHSARLAEDQQKLSTHFGALADVIREAHFWADQAGAAAIGAEHVRQAIESKIYRSSLLQQHIQEQIAQGTLLIDTAGQSVGQVNGLSVISLGDHAFGRPSRITASVGPGRGDIIDIEREVALGGPIHSKGIMILSGYLTQMYTHDQPLTLSARLVFEQSYAGVEGDSASSAELYAMLSALAGLPIRQGIAVTGAVNQHGEVEAIGGINEKIEGFFDICRARGLTGDQGVLMPRSNIPHLMLREDVVAAVRAGQFHIWAVATIAEGIELLTGVAAGQRLLDGQFPEGSLNARVARRLRAFAAAMRAAPPVNGLPPLRVHN
jgi:predicted ATP-dependent protease